MHAIKLSVNALIRGYTLHKIFGFSFRLLGAIFSSITHLLIVNEHESRVKASELLVNKLYEKNLSSSKTEYQKNSIPQISIENPLLQQVRFVNEKNPSQDQNLSSESTKSYFNMLENTSF